MATQDQRIERLSPAKRALLERWRQASASAIPSAGAIPRRPSRETAPLSFAQQRLWFLDQLDPGNPAYNVAAAVRLHGPLDAAALETAIQAAIARHEALRTTFRQVAGQAEQVIHPRLDWRLAQVRLPEENAAAREATWRQMAREEALRPFDLEQGPLLRGTLVQVAPHEHVLLLTLHHIVCDGWSMAVLRHELAEHYMALVDGRALELQPLPLQYGDFACWQREQLTGQRLERLTDFWSQALDPPPPPLELPADLPRPPSQTFRGDVCRAKIDAALAARLRQLAAGEATTLFAVLETALHVLLARYSGQRDICIGTPVANRNHLDLERLIGFFVNTVPLRADLSANPTIRQLLAQVRQSTLAAFAHQELPFERMIDALQLPRDMSRTPLFQVLFVLQNIPLRSEQIAGLTAHEVSFDHAPTSAYDLTLNVDEHPNRIDLSLVYNVDLFTGATAQQLLDDYVSLLAEFLGDPDRRVLELPLASAATAGDMADLGDAAPRSYPHDRCLHDLISDQARRSPDAAALMCGSEIVTYAQLDERSDRLANYLASRGVRPDAAVGLGLPRSTDLIVSLLAILKAGGAYVPLDPSYPPSRLEFMARDADLALLVTTVDLAHRFPDREFDTVCIDRDAAEIAAAGDRPPASAVTPDNLANLIYTSGSTGNPKGVEIEHRGLVNHALQFAQSLNLQPGDRMLQFLSLSFDAAGEEIFPTLISGATLCLHPEPAELSGGVLLDWSRQQGVNVLHLTPPVWLSLIDELEAQGSEAGRHLKAVVAGGDSVRRTDAARWLRATQGGTPFFLAYGVTEATITTTLCDAADEMSPSAIDRLPIGRPLANARIYVLDEFQQPVPIGVRGELYLGGAGVARGYRHRPELTRERFVPDPFARVRGARMYRTGDCGRRLRDGNVEFLGRLDQQVKIRGYRIEPGEIEAALGRHPGVREATVVAADESVSHKQLVGYVTPVSGASVNENELRQFLAESLPAHMIPALFVVVDEFPRLPNGKIDRRSLPSAARRRTTPVATARNEIEQMLADVWAGVLEIAEVGVHDNFFEIGGDSIRSIQVVARARAAGWKITPKQLFQHQTIAELAPLAVPATVVCAQQEPVTGPQPLTPIQREFFALELADPQHFNQAALLEVRAGVPPEIIDAALAAVIAHHDALRLRFERTPQGEWQAVGEPIGAGGVLQRVDLSETSDAGIGPAIEKAATSSQADLDLASGRLVSAVYFDLGPRRAPRLLLAIHHLAVDAVSWRILLEDLSLACGQLSRGAAPSLPPKTTSLAEWGRRLAALADSETVRREAAAWLSAPESRRLPTDMADGRNLVASELTIEVSLPAEETARWLLECHSAYRTRPHELLIAALVETLCAYVGDDQVCIDLEGHGREELFEDVDLSRTVGWFTSLFPATVCRGSQHSPGEVIRSAKEAVRAIPHGGIGYGLLRWSTRDGELRRRMAEVARGEVSFNYLGHVDDLIPAETGFALAPEAIGPVRSLRGARPHVWELIAYVQRGCLKLSWRYAADLHRRQTIERLANDWLDNLRTLVAHCLEPGVGAVTPADFPLAALDQEDLDRLSALLANDGTAAVEKP